MNKWIANTALAFALSAVSLSTSIAQADDKAPPMMGMMGGGCPMMKMMGQGMMSQGMMGGGQRSMGAMIDGRLAYLKSELKITDAQADAWKGYADAVKARMDAMMGMREGMMGAMQKGGAIDRIDARISGMEAMLEAMKAVKPVTMKLYEALTAEQKTIADDLVGRDCGAM